MTIEKQRKYQARQRIKTHIRNKGEDLLEITPTLVRYWWQALNIAIFDSILSPPVKIHCRNFRDGAYGWCMPYLGSNDIEMGIRRELEDRKQFLTVLAHESVHQYQWITERRISHGQSFYAWAPMLKRVLNLPLSEYIDD